jgi:hypothetical protein
LFRTSCDVEKANTKVTVESYTMQTARTSPLVEETIPCFAYLNMIKELLSQVSEDYHDQVTFKQTVYLHTSHLRCVTSQIEVSVETDAIPRDPLLGT